MTMHENVTKEVTREPEEAGLDFDRDPVAAVAEWSRYQIVAGLVTSSSLVPPKTRCVGERCTLNLSRAQTSPCWCGS
ncbi:hypothetical protein TNCV_3942261 [Trichonephila clavipes]|nr:hypothetical protein TNCV_3942261 [Trichonephila clavipes]